MENKIRFPVLDINRVWFYPPHRWTEDTYTPAHSSTGVLVHEHTQNKEDNLVPVHSLKEVLFTFTVRGQTGS